MENNLENVHREDDIFREAVERIFPPFEDEAEKLGMKEELMLTSGDLFFLFYSVFPMLREKNEGVMEAFRRFLEGMMESGEYLEVKALTTLDSFLSEVCASSLLRHLIERLREMSGSSGGSREDLAGIIGVVQDIVGRAKEDVENIREAMAFMTMCGKEPRKEEMRDIVDTVIVRGAEIVSTARRISSAVRYLDVRRVPSRRGIYEGLKITSKPEEAIVKELSMPDDLFYLRWATRNLVGKEKKLASEGDYYLLVDYSGSMDGMKLIWSRSVAFSIAKRGLMRRRKVRLRFFATTLGREYSSERPGEMIKALLTEGSSGGTSIGRALAEALRTAGRDETVVLITDCLDDIPEEAGREISEILKERKVRLVTVVIPDPMKMPAYEQLRRISDEFLLAQPTLDYAVEIVRAF